MTNGDWSRCQTALDAIARLSMNLGQDLHLALLGVDEVECLSMERVKNTFQGLFEGLESLKLERLYVECVGPNVPSATAKHSPALFRVGSLHVQLSAHSKCYHDHIGEGVQEGGGNGPALPDLIIMYNAGLWGYDDWTPTIQVLSRLSEARGVIAGYKRPLAVLVTAYTIAECHADMDRLEEVLGEENLTWHWRPEANPYRGNLDMRRKTHSDTYFENAATLCFSYERTELCFPPSCPPLARSGILGAFDRSLAPGAHTLGLFQTRCCLLELIGIDVSVRELRTLLGANLASSGVDFASFLKLALKLAGERLSPQWYEDAVLSAVGQSDNSQVVSSDSFEAALRSIAPLLAAKHGSQLFAAVDEYKFKKITRSQFRRHLENHLTHAQS